MAFPSEVLSNLVRGKEYYSNINKQFLDNQATGCGCCPPANYDCLGDIIDALDLKIKLDEYDDVAIELDEKLIYIIGSFAGEEPINVYWGFKDNNEVLSYADIIISNKFTVNKGSDIIVNYVTGDPLVFLWWAVSTEETIKNYYQDLGNVDNRGSMGAEDELYGLPTEVVGAINLNFYITNWLTKQNTPLLFKRI